MDTMLARILYWSVFVSTLGVYATMLFWSIPSISAEAAGLVVFDMRPAGYSFAEAQAFLSALTSGGKQFYLKVQLRLDSVYPALLAMTIGWGMIRLAPNWHWRFVLASVPIPGMVFDYLENGAVAAMLAAGADGLTTEIVARASVYSRLKAGFTMLSLGLLFLLVLVWAFRRWKRSAS